MISVVLIEPKTSGNVGAIARVMKNFGFEKLIMVNPQCEIDEEARNRAKHAQEILDNVVVVEEWPVLDYLVGTSGMIGKDYNIPRSPVSPAELSSILPDGDIGVVFGREDTGLSNEEVLKCDFLVTIPANPSYPVLNLSQAVGVVLYELSKEDHTDHIKPIGLGEKEHLLKLIDEQMEKMDFLNEDKKVTQRKVWRRIIGKSFMSNREANALMGFFKKL